ncbi:MAG: DUF389 domain-containing protein [Candidatus Kaiserbacteria bacterium]|nr:DUF389 domain-containing protein [Candidatus Kaiserbacteria bacterium]MCB9815876.1 DUF389 domain-containing protein [Candidatus Nomurabacteria bacterium]
MSVIARFRALPDKDKAALIRKLVQNGTPDFDYFYLIGLSTLMATLGLLLDSSSIVIGSMLIAPLMYPILGVSLGLVMMNNNIKLVQRALSTLLKSLGAGLLLSVVAAALFGTSDPGMFTTAEVMARTEPHFLHLIVAVVAGAAVAYMLARPEWNDALPGVAIAVALVPPLATVGVGIAALDMTIIAGAAMILILNLFGIILTAMLIFQLMNLSEKEHIAESTVKREEEKLEEENKVIAEVTEQITEQKTMEKRVIKEDITAS